MKNGVAILTIWVTKAVQNRMNQ